MFKLALLFDQPYIFFSSFRHLLNAYNIVSSIHNLTLSLQPLHLILFLWHADTITENSDLLLQFPNACKGQDWANVEARSYGSQELQTQWRYAMRMAGMLVFEPSPLSPRNCTAENWSQKLRMNPEALWHWTQTSLSSILTARPNIHPSTTPLYNKFIIANSLLPLEFKFIWDLTSSKS